MVPEGMSAWSAVESYCGAVISEGDRGMSEVEELFFFVVISGCVNAQDKEKGVIVV